jgi:hypothetical protein
LFAAKSTCLPQSRLICREEGLSAAKSVYLTRFKGDPRQIKLIQAETKLSTAIQASVRKSKVICRKMGFSAEKSLYFAAKKVTLRQTSSSGDEEGESPTRGS